jgi:hypothetical protein
MFSIFKIAKDFAINLYEAEPEDGTSFKDMTNDIQTKFRKNKLRTPAQVIADCHRMKTK